MWLLRTGRKEIKNPALPHTYPNYYTVSYEYMFIYDLKNTKLVQKLKCDSFISVALLDGQNIRLKLWDKKSAREGFLTFEPESGQKKLVYEINVIIRHFTPNFIFS